jgi:hypothetical protein
MRQVRDATPKKRVIRGFLLFEAASFAIASLIHHGVLIGGYQHQQAGTAEGVIAGVLLVGWAASWLRPDWTPGIGLVAQGLALLGTFVGIFTIAIGVGPRTVPDLTYHAAIVVVLVWGLIVAARVRSDEVRAV